MKKTTLAVALGALLFSGVASANWYVEGNAGYSRLKTSGLDFDEISDGSFSPSVAVGYKINDWRFALDYTYYGKGDDNYGWSEGSRYGSGETEVKAYGFGVSAYYDFDLNTALKPYVGVRLSANHIKVNDDFNEVSDYFHYSDSDTEFGYGAVVGVTYNLAPSWDLNVAAEYNRLGEVDDVKLNQYGAKIGVRYTF